MLKNEPFLVERREKGNTKAAEMIAIARKVGDLLIRFPYVRGIAISGSLSKNFADDDSDIDPGREEDVEEENESSFVRQL